MTTRTKNYTATKGVIWERLIIIKDRRTHRKRVPTVANATILVNSVKYVIPAEITSEGGILLSLSAENTEWLGAGEFSWDMVAKVSRSALLTSTPIAELHIVKGVLTVEDTANITPLESDGVATPLVAL